MRFTDNEMWKATVDCDNNFDGKFFYAVKTVGVYCRPSCKSRTPIRKSVFYFETQGHRVTGQNGNLTGYVGGIPAKQYLLELKKRYA